MAGNILNSSASRLLTHQNWCHFWQKMWIPLSKLLCCQKRNHYNSCLIVVYFEGIFGCDLPPRSNNHTTPSVWTCKIKTVSVSNNPFVWEKNRWTLHHRRPWLRICNVKKKVWFHWCLNPGFGRWKFLDVLVCRGVLGPWFWFYGMFWFCKDMIGAAISSSTIPFWRRFWLIY